MDSSLDIDAPARLTCRCGGEIRKKGGVWSCPDCRRKYHSKLVTPIVKKHQTRNRTPKHSRGVNPWFKKQVKLRAR